jgi:hypothetical protein
MSHFQRPSLGFRVVGDFKLLRERMRLTTLCRNHPRGEAIGGAQDSKGSYCVVTVDRTVNDLPVSTVLGSCRAGSAECGRTSESTPAGRANSISISTFQQPRQ